MHIMSEWKAFGSFAVDYLGMPSDAMPFYSSSNIWKRKARRIMNYIMKVGNMGHNRDMSFYSENNRIVKKFKAFWMRVTVLSSHARIFPFDSFRFLPFMVYSGVKSYIRGE